MGADLAMKPLHTKKIGSLSFIVLLLASSVALISSASPVLAEQELSEASTTASSIDSEVSAASGPNKFVVWFDFSSGNNEILFRRSIDYGVTWQATVNLSDNPGPSQVPQIAVSGSNVYVVWLQFNAQDELPNVFFRHSADNGATWGARIKISTSGMNDDAIPQLAAFGGHVYIVWHETGPSGDVYFRRSTDNGVTWESIINLSSDPGDSFLPQIAVSGSKVYVVWFGYYPDNNADNTEILLMRSNDNGATWKLVKNVSNSDEFSNFPQIAVSGSNVYVVWWDDYLDNEEVFFRRSTDGGVSWQPKVNLSNNGGISRSPEVAVSGSNVYVAWIDETPGNSDVFIRRSTDNGATWKSIKNLSNNAGGIFNLFFIPEIVASGSRVFVVWQDSTPGNPDIFLRRSTDNGATWKSVRNLSNNAGLSLDPQLAVAGSSVYVVWNDDTPGNNDIMFRRSSDNGATWKSIKDLSNNAGSSNSPQIAV